MTPLMQFPSASSKTSTNFESQSTPKLMVVGRYSIAASSKSAHECVVIELDHSLPTAELSANHTSVEELIRELSTDEDMAKEIRAAREWVGEQLYPDAVSLKQLRLKKGKTQTELAAEIGTSQPYIARIEGGQQTSLQLATMRKLCAALSIDMNTLNEACRHGDSSVQPEAL